MINKVWYRLQTTGQIIKPSPENVYFCTNDFQYIADFMESVEDPEVLAFSVDPNMHVIDLYDNPFSEKCGYPDLADVLACSESFPTAYSALPEIAKCGGEPGSIREKLERLNNNLYFLNDIVEASPQQQADLAKWANDIARRALLKYKNAKKGYKIAIADLLKAEPGIQGILDFEGSLILINPDVMQYIMNGIKPLTRDEFEKLYDSQLDVMQCDDPKKVFYAINSIREN